MFTRGRAWFDSETVRGKCFENRFNGSPRTRPAHSPVGADFSEPATVHPQRVNINLYSPLSSHLPRLPAYGNAPRRHDSRKPFRNVRIARFVHQNHEGKNYCTHFTIYYLFYTYARRFFASDICFGTVNCLCGNIKHLYTRVEMPVHTRIYKKIYLH